ncbi:histidine phosphatase family protein [Hydrogenothermus marinus]|uniref:phosphoglycerate mutase (2,3-diphosphoglycerate-dependent) n=1 Tax=Hydrogenothermus marinus TaxID=133270 RepID=A0A3M0BFC9_9AQUI|nr:histidine phosphatase family protein [Hydrogenothermus marinus]RMA96020.1 putative phosphoglycerate mutase [Hydrogenothermus marinus]
MLKNLYLCRHGESEYNAKKIIQGHIDTFLTPKGVFQARLAGEKLKKYKIEKIYTSDLRRAYQTATVIGDILGIEPIVDERIREMHFGQWEGLGYDYIFKTKKEDWDNWLKNPVACPLPNQEECIDFEKRLKDFLNQIKKEKEENVLIVGHGGSIQGIICIETQLGLENLWSFRHDNTGISCLEYKDNKAYIKFVNI